MNPDAPIAVNPRIALFAAACGVGELVGDALALGFALGADVGDAVAIGDAIGVVLEAPPPPPLQAFATTTNALATSKR